MSATAATTPDGPAGSARAESRKRLLETLHERGLMPPSKRGRPCLYHTDEERRAVLREQKKLCSRRYDERVRAARQLLREAMTQQEENLA